MRQALGFVQALLKLVGQTSSSSSDYRKGYVDALREIEEWLEETIELEEV